MRALLVLFLTAMLLADTAPATVPQVWLDASTMVFHSPGCEKIGPDMQRMARTVAKMQGFAPAKECALTDAEAKERWKKDAAKYQVGSGFADFGDSVRRVPRTRSAKDSPSSGTQPSRQKAVPSPPDRNAVMAATTLHAAEDGITTRCVRQWAGDTKMQEYCIEKQVQALSALRQGKPFGDDQDAWGAKRLKCASQWPDDYSMRVYCEGRP